MWRVQRLLLSALVVATIPVLAQTPSKTELNVVYGMHSGLALLMDVYFPAQSNGRAVIGIPGSGWNMPLGYDAVPLKERGVAAWRGLTDAGYTLFVINHRATPAFQYPAPVEDAQRAVRFIRANAKRFAITSDQMGAIGGSSGGHLVAMLGTLDGKGDAGDSDPVNRLSAKVQSVVAIYGAFDLKGIQTALGGPAVALLVGSRPPRGSGPPNSAESRRFADASPVTYVTADDAPFLLFHGDADATVPFEQSGILESALKKAGVPVTFIPVPGGGHGANFLLKPGDPRLPDVIGHATKWFDTYLKSTQRSSR
jgi:acetyl esterase/lipase